MNISYLDNAATTPLCEESKGAIINALDCFGNPSSLHSMGLKSSILLENSRETIAKSIKADKGEIIFTSGGTECDNMAIMGAAHSLKRRGNKIVTTAFEHSAVINSMKQLENEGFEVEYLKPDESGTVPKSAFINAITKDTILVSCMSVNNETGAKLPIEIIKKCIDRANSPAIFHCDATQSYMKYPIVPSRLGIDLMTMSSHKIHGPKGVGALYIRNGVRILPNVFGGAQEKGIRPGTEPLILISGFAAAVNAFGDQRENLSKVSEIKKYIVEKLEGFDDVILNSPVNSSEYVLNISVLGIRSETMLHFLEQKNVFISSGSACSKGKASHVLAALDFDRKRIDSALRISFSKFNTIDDARNIVSGILEAREKLIKAK